MFEPNFVETKISKMPKRKLKRIEKWALERLHETHSRIFGDDFQVHLPTQDPPDCIIASKDGTIKQPIEFTAFGHWEVFEFLQKN